MQYAPVLVELIACGIMQLPKECVWELEMREHPGGTWNTIHPVRDSLTVVADRLTSGTKYIFRARAGALLCPD